jgi:hypothetical protein
MALIPRDHIGQECLDSPPIAQQIDVEDLAEVLFRRVEDGMCLRNASVVDENGWLADSGADLVRSFGDSGEIGDVAGEEVDERIWLNISYAFPTKVRE